ncbi:MAG: tetratricopeptide repeat protein [Candidatus Sumerlaeaceae bacterium]|nr:tetratricopeptide repeat protein [Candidatus Sumerlaeaceae bacterium]
MQCPYCQTENREDRERCYVCDRDISMLRLIVNKARHHYNQGLEHAERGRISEAIDELHNAIDLDRRFVSAHVVLGTLYARLNNFEKAQAAWQAALALQPELNKAHSYLQKAESVQACYPMVRNMQVLSGILLVLALVLTGMIVFMRRKDETAEFLRAAQEAYEAQRYNSALVELNRIGSTPARWQVVPIAARALRSAIEAEMRQRIQIIQELKYREDYAAALAALADLEAREPDDQTSAVAATIREDINHYFRQRLEALLNDFAEDRATYADIATRVTEYLQVYPEGPGKDEFRAYLERARSLEVKRRLDAVRNRFAEARDIPEALANLQVLAAEFPGNETVKRGRAEIIEEILNWSFTRFQEQLDKKDFDGAGETLKIISDLASEFADIVDVTGPVELAFRVLTDAKQDRRLAAVEALVRQGDLAEANEAIIDLLAEETLTSGELELVDSLIATVDRRTARQRANDILAAEQDFLRLRASDAKATATLAEYEWVLLKAPDMSRSDRVRVLACAAAAAIKLGQNATAETLIARIEKDKGDPALVNALRRLQRPKAR